MRISEFVLLSLNNIQLIKKVCLKIFNLSLYLHRRFTHIQQLFSILVQNGGKN